MTPLVARKDLQDKIASGKMLVNYKALFKDSNSVALTHVNFMQQATIGSIMQNELCRHDSIRWHDGRTASFHKIDGGQEA
jgi:hypothetical protein